MNNISINDQERLVPSSPLPANVLASNEKFLTYGLILLLFSLITATITLASVPPVDRDALTHHLFVPKLWLRHGGIYEIPDILFSYYPMNLDLLYMIPLYFGNDIAPKYIHYFFTLLTAWVIYQYLHKRLGSKYGLLGALFFLSIPIIFKLSITVYVDLGLVFFTTASLLLLLHWASNSFQWRSLILAGLCCGLAAGTKYNGLITIFVLTLFVPIIYQRGIEQEKQSNSKALLFGFVFAATTFVTFSPWLIKNYVWTENPIYPLHNSLFQKTQKSDNDAASQTSTEETLNPLLQITSKSSGAFTSRKVLYHETWWQALLLPVRIFFEGQDDNPQFFDGKLTPSLLLLPLMAFFFKSPSMQKNRERKILLSFALLYFFLTFSQEAIRIRYFAPIVPPLVILSIYGLHGLGYRLYQRTEGRAVHRALAACIIVGIPCLMLLYNALYIRTQFSLVNPIPFILGKVSRDEYITAYRPEFATIQYVNSHHTLDSKVLCIFLGNRGYYMDFQPIFEQPFNSSGIFSKFLERNESKMDILKIMQQNGIEHVLMRDDLTLSWFQKLSDKDKSLISPLFQNASKPLFKRNGYTFFSLVSEDRIPSTQS